MKPCKPGSDNLSRIKIISCVAAAVLMSQGGCASFKPSGILSASRSAVEEPAEPLSESGIELKLAFAKASEAKGDHKQALSAYEELVRMNAASAEVHHRLALIYDRKGDAAQAETHYLASLDKQPDDAKVLSDYGYSLYLRESFEASEAQYLKAIAADPQYLRARVNFGMLLARTGRVEEGIRQFALGGLSEGAAHHNIALAATENGDTATATAALARSQQADQGGSSSGNHHALGQVVERIAALR